MFDDCHDNRDQEDHECNHYHNHEDEGEEEDEEDDDDDVPYPGLRLERNPNPELPETVTLLKTEDGGSVYIVGTAHFSQQSQEDVAKVTELTENKIDSCAHSVNDPEMGLNEY